MNSYNWFWGEFKSIPPGLENYCLDNIGICTAVSYAFKRLDENYWYFIPLLISKQRKIVGFSSGYDAYIFDTDFGKKFITSNRTKDGHCFITDKEVIASLNKCIQGRVSTLSFKLGVDGKYHIDAKYHYPTYLDSNMTRHRNTTFTVKSVPLNEEDRKVGKSEWILDSVGITEPKGIIVKPEGV